MHVHSQTLTYIYEQITSTENRHMLKKDSPNCAESFRGEDRADFSVQNSNNNNYYAYILYVLYFSKFQLRMNNSLSGRLLCQ